MSILQHKIFIAAGSILLFISAAIAAYYQMPALFFAPALCLLALYVMQQPIILFYLLLAAIPWSIEFNVTESLGTDLPDEPLMLLLSFTMAALLIVRRRKISRQSLHPLLLVLFIGVAWSAITVILSTNVLLSVKYFLSKSWYLLAFVGAPLLLLNDVKQVKHSAIILFSSMFLATLIALYRHALQGFTFATINDALAPFFRNHVNYSALLVFMVPLQIAFYQSAKTRNRKRLLLLSILIILAALYLSYARGAWLALVAGGLSYWLIKKGWLFKSFVVSIFIIVTLVYWLQHNDQYLAFAPKHDITIFHNDFSEHLTATYKGTDVSTAERFYRWVAGAKMSKEKWATGYGPTTFYENYKSYTVPLFRTWVSDNKEHSTVHNYFLLLLIEQGVAGLLIFLCLIGMMFWYAQKIYQRSDNRFWKITAAAIAAILWMECTVNFLSDLIETDKAGSVFYLCLAFLIMADRNTRPKMDKLKEEIAALPS